MMNTIGKKEANLIDLTKNKSPNTMSLIQVELIKNHSTLIKGKKTKIILKMIARVGIQNLESLDLINDQIIIKVEIQKYKVLIMKTIKTIIHQL